MADPADRLFNDFPLKERRHYEKDQSQSHLANGLVPHQEEKLTAVHINRHHAAHADHLQAELQDQGAQPSRSSAWQTSYQAQTAGDDSSQRKRPQGKRCVHQQTRAGSLGVFAGFGTRGLSEAERIAQLQLGTTKASRHLPGYTGHIPAQPAASDQPVNTRDLDKSRSLIVQNYKPFPGYTGRLK